VELRELYRSKHNKFRRWSLVKELTDKEKLDNVTIAFSKTLAWLVIKHPEIYEEWLQNLKWVEGGLK